MPRQVSILRSVREARTSPALIFSIPELATLSIVEVSFSLPTEDEQTGPFYSTEIPNQILKIRYMGNINADPFALSTGSNRVVGEP
jgi:hypothetical protein